MELLAKITIAHEEGFSMVLAEWVKKNERSVGCNGEKSEAQSGVSMAGSYENENEDEDFLHRRILDSIVNWHGCEEEKVGNENENGVSLTFKKEEMGNREIRKEMDVEIVRCNVSELHVEKSEDQSRRIAIDDYYVERDTGSVREEEKGNYNENDEDSLQRRILDSIVNWHGCEEEEEEEKVDNVETERLQNGVDGESGGHCKVSELQAEKVEDQSWRFVIDEEKVDNEDEDEDEENSLHRRILCSIVNWHGY